MGYPINQETTRAANTLSTVVFEGNGRFPLAEEILIEGVQHFKE
jgi:hypothetical protein